MEDLVSTFGSEDVAEATRTILQRGSIQLTTAQRKARVEAMRQRILHHIHSEAVDPRTSRPIRGTSRACAGGKPLLCGSLQAP